MAVIARPIGLRVTWGYQKCVGDAREMPVGSRQDNGQDNGPGGHVTATATRKRPPQRYDPVLVDQRTRLARRARTIERQLRAEVERLGRTVTVHDDILIGQLAACMVRSEVMRGEASRGGQPVSDEQLTRLANTAQRLVGALGLRPQVTEPPPSLGVYLAGK